MGSTDVWKSNLAGFVRNIKRLEVRLNVQQIKCSKSPLMSCIEMLHSKSLTGENLQCRAPIDNTPLLCPHQKVTPKSSPIMKRITAKAWKQLEALVRAFHGLPSSIF
jgi:hypothetical protein